MATTLTSRPLDFFKPDPNQPRKEFPESSLLALGESLKIHQNDPVQARPDGTLIDGERRWRAATLVGLGKLDVIITDVELTDTQINIVRLTSFFHREDLSAHEKWLACQRLLELNPGWLAKDLAGHLHIDRSMVTRHLSPSKCIPAWQEALREGKVGVSDVYAASKLPESEQSELLAMKLGGASRDQIEHRSRSLRKNGEAHGIKVNRLKIPLGLQGRSVTIEGSNLTLSDAIEILQHTLKLARKAQGECLDAKTFVRVMKDKSKAGG
jgi:ParB family transcriptional regulator, chromosome partitioning protein